MFSRDSLKVRILLILPSHYDDDGYPYRFWKGLLPSNTLVCLKGLVLRCVERGELKGYSEVVVESLDEYVQKVDVDKIVRRSIKRRERLIVCLVGVQTNMFSRASDLAMEFRKHNVPVLMGGFHISGVIKMFGGPTKDLQRLIDWGVSLVCGEVEGDGVMSMLLNDAIAGTLKPYYIIEPSPDITDAPILPASGEYLKHFMQPMCTIDTSRGCPYNCSFCSIINVQGRKIRCRSVDKILSVIRTNYENGFYSYFFTDDNLSKSPIWRELFEGLVRLKQEEEIKIRFMMQVDTQAYKIPGFVDLAKEAGCYLVFVGMESVNPDNLDVMGKKQNKVGEYAKMVEVWHDAGILVHVGYIVGMPFDTPESVRRDVDILKDQIKVDEASFFIMTPIPGSRDHKERVDRGEELESDWNAYDSCHETFEHLNFEKGALKKAWIEAWENFYSKKNIVDILLRCSAEQYWNAFWLTLWNRYSSLLGNHPMSMGFIQLKRRKDRRPTKERESVVEFWKRRIRDFSDVIKTVVRVFWEYQEIWLLTRKELREKRTLLAELYKRYREYEAHLLNLMRENPISVRFSKEYEKLVDSFNNMVAELVEKTKNCDEKAFRKIDKIFSDMRDRFQSVSFSGVCHKDLFEFQREVVGYLVKSYEEAVVKSVMYRRRLNTWWLGFAQSVKEKRMSFSQLFKLPGVVAWEVYWGLRFSISAVRMK
ncbi:MAG: radical SAM protein [Candidatus Hydrogenedentes bacterium]|nr:radical SAM protein [Candidatus Hydrogenedentota bacterium]